MTTDQLLEEYGTISNVAEKLGVSYQAVQQWIDNKQIPEGRQWQIQVLTDGRLVCDSYVAA